jgi:hypothetical protein
MKPLGRITLGGGLLLVAGPLLGQTKSQQPPQPSPAVAIEASFYGATRPRTASVRAELFALSQRAGGLRAADFRHYRHAHACTRRAQRS